MTEPADWGGAAVCVCILAHGSPFYLKAGEIAAESVLTHSCFDVFLARGGSADDRPQQRRVRTCELAAPSPDAHRSLRFLAKFRALQACLRRTGARYVILLDADAVFARSTSVDDVAEALGDYDLGMVEQTTIKGSTLGRREFLMHYVEHTMVWFDTNAPAPDPGEFRYYNSGVVIGRTSTMREITQWALSRISETGRSHQVGRHMIADQDYFQFWACTLHPHRCTTLPWRWNHCEHWDEGFPDPRARIMHFSNFCAGPGAGTIARMEASANRPQQLGAAAKQR